MPISRAEIAEAFGMTQEQFELLVEALKRSVAKHQLGIVLEQERQKAAQERAQEEESIRAAMDAYVVPLQTQKQENEAQRAQKIAELEAMRNLLSAEYGPDVSWPAVYEQVENVVREAKHK